jgi:hypothetical protein
LGVVECVRDFLDKYPAVETVEKAWKVTWNNYFATYSKEDAGVQTAKRKSALEIRQPGWHDDEELPRGVRRGPWWAICPQSEGHRLARMNVKLTRKQYPSSDPDSPLLWLVEAPDCPSSDVILLHGLPKTETERDLDDARIAEEGEGITHTISLTLGSQHYQLRAVHDVLHADDGRDDAVLVLRNERSDQILFPMLMPNFRVLWAGDFDGDGSLDFVLKMKAPEDSSISLYLGRRDNLEIVKLAATFDHSGC